MPRGVHLARPARPGYHIGVNPNGRANLLGRPLSERELQVLIACGSGRPQKEVAGDLGITDQTVKNIASNAYQKLGARSLIEAYRVLGWLRLPTDTEANQATQAYRTQREAAAAFQAIRDQIDLILGRLAVQVQLEPQEVLPSDGVIPQLAGSARPTGPDAAKTDLHQANPTREALQTLSHQRVQVVQSAPSDGSGGGSRPKSYHPRG